MSSQGAFFQVAIDGPVAAGKGTISKLVAERLGFVYIDTGAMYRMTALLSIRNTIDWDDEAGIAKLIHDAKMEMRNPTDEERDGRLSTILLDGEDVSWKIRTEDISQGASRVAQYPHVREELVAKQQEIAKTQNVVMEGRDITYRVLPNAQLKIFLTASDVVRAKRRHLQLLSQGVDEGFEQVYQEMIERDKRDSERSVDPLQIVPEAWVLDTSDLGIEEVTDLVVAKVKSLRAE